MSSTETRDHSPMTLSDLERWYQLLENFWVANSLKHTVHVAYWTTVYTHV